MNMAQVEHDAEYFASHNEQTASMTTGVRQHYHNDNNIDELITVRSGICLILGLGSYTIDISLETSDIPSREALFKPIARVARSLRRWRCEGFLLLAWLLQVCLVLILRAVEASEVDAACAKEPG